MNQEHSQQEESVPTHAETAATDSPEALIESLRAELEQLRADGLRERGGVVARRYRGLAAIDARVLAATCIVPASRRTSPVSAAQAAALIGMLNASAMGARRAAEES
jgi:hypothetical protein